MIREMDFPNRDDDRGSDYKGKVRMKRLMFILLVLSAQCCFGRIGETEQDMEKRLGHSIARDEVCGYQRRFYAIGVTDMAMCDVVATYDKGRVVEMHIFSHDGKRKFKKEELENIIESERGGLKWNIDPTANTKSVPNSSTWIRSDNKIKMDVLETSVFFTDLEWLKRANFDPKIDLKNL